MALNFQLEPTPHTDFKLSNLVAKSFRLVHGYFTYDSSASASALTVTAAMVGLNALKGFIATPVGSSISGNQVIMFTWSPSTNMLAPIGAVQTSITADIGAVIATASFVVAASITSIPFLAWGYT